MDTGADAGLDERLVQALERLTHINESIAGLHREAIQIRTRIRDLDVNVEALNMLANAKSRDEKGDGERVLLDLIRYARQTGMHLEGLGLDRDAPLALPAAAESEESTGVETVGEQASKRRLKLLSQVVVAMAVTSGLFALIH